MWGGVKCGDEMWGGAVSECNGEEVGWGEVHVGWGEVWGCGVGRRVVGWGVGMWGEV